jgi:hypothetical protein
MTLKVNLPNLTNWQPFMLLLLFLTAATGVYAQCEAALSITGVRAKEQDDEIILTFGYETDWKGDHQNLVSAAENKGNWIVFSPTLLEKARAATDRVERASLYDAATPEIESVAVSGARGLKIKTLAALQKDEKYMVNVTGGNSLIPAKCVADPTAVTIVTPPAAGNTATQANPAAPPSKTVIVPVKKREDAEIYVEGMMEGARRAKTAFTVDASVNKRFLYNKDEPEYFWQPFFNIKASTAAKADPNALNFGVNFENPSGRLPDNVLALKRLYFSEAAKFEADKDFKNVNFVGDFRLRLVSRHLNQGRVNIVPFFGMELGKNLKSPVAEAKGKLIARPLFGARLYYNLYTKEAAGGYQKALAFETLYERRFLLKREVALDADDDGNFIGVPLTRAPRDYVKSSFVYDFAKNFGFKLNYEYGSLPPLFKLVDNKFSVGLVFKGKFDEK